MLPPARRLPERTAEGCSVEGSADDGAAGGSAAEVAVAPVLIGPISVAAGDGVAAIADAGSLLPSDSVGAIDDEDSVALRVRSGHESVCVVV